MKLKSINEKERVVDMNIKCCKDCVAPKRHLGCHSTCSEYLTERAKMDERNEKRRLEKKKGPMPINGHWR